jgi:hypothetical protein
MPSIAQFLEMLSDDDDGITCGLQHLLKSRNYASTSSSPIVTHEYDNSDNDVHLILFQSQCCW